MLEDYFKEILEKYEKEKTKPFKYNNLVFKIRNDISTEVFKLIGTDFTVKGACGVSSWPESPWITIIGNDFDSSQEALIIQYNFNTKESTMSLSIILRLKYNDEYVSIKRFLINSIDTVNLNGFQINENDTSNIILYKSYTYNQINNKLLKSDLDFIIPIYNNLSGLFKNNFLKEEQISHLQYAETSKIKDIEYDYKKEKIYPNYLNSSEELFSDENIDKIIKCSISYNDYGEILSNIKDESKLTDIIYKFNINLDELSAKDKILLFSKSYVKTEYKSVGRLLGSYSFNEIKIDDRLSNPLIITSIIHELTHFLLENILKEILMKILNTNDTPLISSYIKIMLEDNDLNYILDEFCAHTVEGRFALYGFQDYSSFNSKLNEISHLYSKEDIDYALVIANTFAYDIKEIFEEFIDEDLREDIKDEFLKLHIQPNFEPLDLEITSKLDNKNFMQAIAILLTSGIGEVLNSGEKLERYMKKYDNLL